MIIDGKLSHRGKKKDSANKMVDMKESQQEMKVEVKLAKQIKIVGRIKNFYVIQKAMDS